MIRYYPITNLKFEVIFDHKNQANFSEISGLSVEIETEDYHEGGVNDFVHVLPKTVKYQAKQRFENFPLHLPHLASEPVPVNVKQSFTLSPLFHWTLVNRIDMRPALTIKKDYLDHIAASSPTEFLTRPFQHAPTPCQVLWGSLKFNGVLENMDKKYILFSSDGRNIEKIDPALKKSINSITITKAIGPH